MLLGVNIDHVATLRNARGESEPSVIEAARICIEAGANGITAHLREDRRHIKDEDIFSLKNDLKCRLNMEMAATQEMKEIVLESLNPGEKTSVNVILNGMDKFKAGNYCCYLEFKVDGKNFGNNIVVNIKVIDKDVKSEFKTVINAFKGHYDLPRSVVSDTNIGKELYHGKTFEKACDNILKSYDGKVEEKKNKKNN